MRALIRATLVVAIGIVLSACATLEATKAPDADLSAIKTLYVQRLPTDERGIQRLIAERLNTLGYRASHGASETPPGEVDAIVTYQDRWMWDITMYMLRLNIQVRDAKTGAILANGESYRPSLERKSPEEMVAEVLEVIFKK